jgi:hypothetical protein
MTLAEENANESGHKWMIYTPPAPSQIDPPPPPPHLDLAAYFCGISGVLLFTKIVGL